MEASLRSCCGKAGVEFDVVEGSHVYARSEDGRDCFIEWTDLTPELKEKSLLAAKRIQDAFGEAEGVIEEVLKRALEVA